MTAPTALRVQGLTSWPLTRPTPPAAVLAGLLALVVVTCIYGPGLLSGRRLVPADMLEAFSPWNTETYGRRPANGLLGDQVQQMYPWRVFVHDELAAGRFPLWNPYAGGGVPLFANGQAAVLFPLNLATLWLDPALAATLVQMLKPPLAAVGMALFLRAVGVGVAGSLLGSLAWAFSGPMVTWLGWPHTNALLMLPYLFWSTTRWLQAPSIRWWVVLAAIVAIQFFGGHPETSAHSVFALGIYILVWLVADRDLGRFIRRGVGWLGAVVAGTALAAIQVVPLLEAIGYSLSAAERGAGAQSRVILEPETLLTWLVPSYFGTPLAQTFGQLNFLNYNETLGYVGVGTLVLGLAAVAFPLRRAWWGLLFVALVALGLTYGWPLITELRRMPGLAHAANTRFLFIAAFGIASLAALGLDVCIRRRVPWLTALATAALFGGAIAGAVLALSPDVLLPGAEEAAPLTALAAAGWRQGELWKTALLCCAWALALGCLLLPRRPAGVAGMAIVVLVLDLGVFGASYNPMIESERVHRVPDAIQFIKNRATQDHTPQGQAGLDQPAGTAATFTAGVAAGSTATERVVALGDGLLPNAAMLYGVEDFRVYEPVAHRRVLQFFEALSPEIATNVRSRFYLFLYEPSVALLSLGGVRWVLVPERDPLLAPVLSDLSTQGLGLQYRDAAAALWENPFAQPPAYLATGVVKVNSEALALEWVKQWTPDRAGQAVVEGEPAVGLPSPVPGQILARRAWPGRIEVDVSAPEGGLLVINDTLYPGWSAQVDGASAALLPANYLFMGVPLPPGAQHVTVEYRPHSVFVGVVISLASLTLLMALLGGRRILSGWNVVPDKRAGPVG